MANDASRNPDKDQHGAMRLRGLTIDNYNLTIRDPDTNGFLGDRASQTAFRDLLDDLRRHHRTGKDPFGKTPTNDVGKKEIDLAMIGGDPDAAHLVHVAVEQYARNLADVIGRFLAQPPWHGVEAIVLGGGLIEGQSGHLAIRRANRMLKLARAGVELRMLSVDPDEGGLLGWASLLPESVASKFDFFLAADVGGTNIRCGIVEHRLDRADDGSKARLAEHAQWRHADDAPSRKEAVTRMAGMLNGLAAQARTRGLRLAPFVGVACPGQMASDGTIPQGAQNLPGNWEPPFHFPDALRSLLDRIERRKPVVVLHNDAVVQGLSERRPMRKKSRWAIMTIGTGLGNASYTNKA